MRKFLRQLSLVSLAFCGLPGLFSCQTSLMPLPQAQFRPGQASLQFQAQARQNYFPMEHGRFWQFELSQRQNGSDNTKYKTLKMQLEALDETPAVQRAVLHRQVSGSNVTPKSSLIQRYPDRVELSRYQQSGEDQTLAYLSTESLAPFATAGYIIAMQFPLQIGQCWEGRAFKGGQESICVKNFEQLDLPAGRFDTVMIEHHLQYNNGKEDFLRYWYAAGVGMVKMHEELTVYFGQWLKLESTGVLTDYGHSPS